MTKHLTTKLKDFTNNLFIKSKLNYHEDQYGFGIEAYRLYS
jgi:hypothetical protein